MKLKYIIPVLAVVATVSCQKDEDASNFNDDPSAVRLTATVGGMFTRSNPTDDAKSAVFNSGDQIMVSADTQSAVSYTFDGTKWSPEAGTYLRWDTETMAFTAWYPSTASMTDFTLPTDQSNMANIASADYMTYSGSQTHNGTTALDLTLQRKTARVIVKIAAFGEQYTPDQKNVSGVKISSGAASYSGSTVSGAVTQTTPFATGSGALNSTYTALVIPSSEQASENFVSLVDGQGATLYVKGIPALEAGKSYAYDVMVGKDNVTITSISVTDWTTGAALEDGDTEEVLPAKVGDYYYQNGTYSAIYTGGADNPCVGVVFWVDQTDNTKGKIVSLDEKNNIAWTTNPDYYSMYDTHATSTLNGLENMAAIKKLDDDYSDFPPFEWCAEKTSGGLTWYLPSNKELQQLFAASSGLRWVESGANAENKEIDDWDPLDDYNDMPNYTDFTAARATFNALFTASGVGGTILMLEDEYLSSTQAGTSNVWTVSFRRGGKWADDRDFSSHARAIAKF